jgi:hypothetical protein
LAHDNYFTTAVFDAIAVFLDIAVTLVDLTDPTFGLAGTTFGLTGTTFDLAGTFFGLADVLRLTGVLFGEALTASVLPMIVFVCASYN